MHRTLVQIRILGNAAHLETATLHENLLYSCGGATISATWAVTTVKTMSAIINNAPVVFQFFIIFSSLTDFRRNSGFLLRFDPQDFIQGRL